MMMMVVMVMMTICRTRIGPCYNSIPTACACNNNKLVLSLNNWIWFSENTQVFSLRVFCLFVCLFVLFVKAYFELCTRSEEQAHFGRCSTGKSLQVVVSMQSTFSFKTLTRQDDLDFRQPYVHVTECICTLCLCCCMYSVCVALSVFIRVCTSVDLLRMCYVLWFTRHYETWL